jgi:hypothetical protein
VRHAALRHARRKGTTHSNQNKNYPQPVKQLKPMALSRDLSDFREHAAESRLWRIAARPENRLAAKN